MNSKNRSQSSQPKSICFRDTVEVNVHGIIILWGNMEEILSGISNLNSCFWWIIRFIVFPLCIDCWGIGSQNLRPSLASILNPKYIFFFLLSTQIFPFTYFLILLKYTYLYIPLDIYLEWAGWFLMVELILWQKSEQKYWFLVFWPCFSPREIFPTNDMYEDLIIGVTQYKLFPQRPQKKSLIKTTCTFLTTLCLSHHLFSWDRFTIFCTQR